MLPVLAQEDELCAEDVVVLLKMGQHYQVCWSLLYMLTYADLANGAAVAGNVGLSQQVATNAITLEAL